MAKLHSVEKEKIEDLQKNGIPLFDIKDEIKRTKSCREAVAAKIGS